MAKDKTIISIDALQRRLHQAELTYGSGIEITLDDDLNIEPYNRPDLAEETPEESAKRAERQQKELLDRAEDKAEAPRLTRPVEALRADAKEANKVAPVAKEGSRTER